METTTLEKEQTVIMQTIYDNIYKSGDREFGYPSNDWSLSNHLKTLLGEEGRVSFPVEAAVGEGEAERFVQAEIAHFTYSASQLFSPNLVLHWLSKGVLTKEDFFSWMKEHCAPEGYFSVFKERIMDNKIDTFSAYTPSEYFFKTSMICIKDGGFAKPEQRKVLVPTFTMSYRPVINVEYRTSDDKRLTKMSVRKYTQFLLKHFYKSLLPKISKEPEFESRFTVFETNLTNLEQKMSQIPVKQKGQMYISALPEDILTASINSRSWSSCLGDDGCNWAAPYHYVQSENVAVAFFIPENSKNKLTTLSDSLERRVTKDVHFFNKTWRQFFIISDGLSILQVNKAYPYQSEDLTKHVTDFLSVKALSLKPELLPNHIIYTRKNTYLESTKTILGNPEEKHVHVQGICSSCSSTEMGDDSANSLLCINCDPCMPLCERCGERTHEDDMTYVEDYGCVCDYCLTGGDFTYCNETGCHYYSMHTVEIFGDSYLLDNLRRGAFSVMNQNGDEYPLYSPTFVLKSDIDANRREIEDVIREVYDLDLYPRFEEGDIIGLYKNSELVLSFEL